MEFVSKRSSSAQLLSIDGSMRRWVLVGIFFVALTMRMLVLIYVGHEPRKFYTYDSDGYERRALNLLHYHVFSSSEYPPFVPDLDRTPIYPGFIAGLYAVFGQAPIVVVLFQIWLGSCTAMLTYALARALRLSYCVGAIAALAVALEPISIMTANRILTETLFTFVLVLSLWLLVSYWRTSNMWMLIGAAISFGCLSLVRPVSQFLPLVLLPLFGGAMWRSAWRKLVLAMLVFVVLSMSLTYSWAYRNYRQTGVFTISTIGDVNLLYYRARAVQAAVDGTTQDEAWEKINRRIAHITAQLQLTTAEKTHLQRREALAILSRYPGLTLLMTLKGAVRMVVDPGYTITCSMLDRWSTSFDCFPGKSSMNESGMLQKALDRFRMMSLVQQVTLVWSVLLLVWMYISLAIALVLLFRKRSWLVLALLSVVVLYFIALSAGAEANSRFRIPLVPLLAILAGVGTEQLWRRWQGYAQPRRL